ncbi:MAG: hypothetical protein ACTHQ3_16410 [Motilibacteraceae bacterium]
MVAWYLVVPGLTLLLWLAHAWESWRRPASVGPFGWLLLAGLPVVLAGVVVAFALVGPDVQPGQYEVLAPGQVHDGRRRLLVLGAEVLASWLAVLLLEAVLSAVRSAVPSSRLRPKDRHL